LEGDDARFVVEQNRKVVAAGPVRGACRGRGPLAANRPVGASGPRPFANQIEM
jgi:hypothetical protein